MKRIALVLFLLGTLLADSSIAQNKYTISGYLNEEETGEDLIGANIFIKELLKGTSTNQYGFYSITVPEGTYTLIFSYLGYQDYSQTIELNKDTRLNIPLKDAAITTDEVVIESERPEENINSGQMGSVTLEVSQIKALPALMGEVDILKTI